MIEFHKSIHPSLVNAFYKKLNGFPQEEKRMLKRVMLFADNAHENQCRKSGEPYIIHPIAVAETLIDIGMDSPTVAAGLLHDVLEDTKYTFADLEENFSQEIASLVDGVTKIKNIDVTSKTEQEAQTIRKMFFAMVNDPRIIIIKLSDKFHNMKTLKYLDPKRAREIAFECLDVYAPLSDRLGINALKIKLEDEAFKVLNPDVYKQIEEYINEQVDDQERFLENTENVIKENLVKYTIKNIEISSRIKHMYSIYQKMRRRGREVNQIQDIYGMRIICNSIVECYTILGIIHGLWTPVDGHFKDYIAMPKANNYQSLHTTVVVPYEKKVKQLEIQIRTFEMDAVANYGVASHWAYKAESGREKVVGGWNETDDKERFIKLVNRMKNWREEIQKSDDFMQEITSNLLKDSIVVFTPKGKAVELPAGSTALDFAYAIHTEVGNKCHMAKANGNIIALSEPLKNTDIVEIITSQNATPRENWLKYAFTQSARRKIKSYLNKHDSSVMFAKDLIVKNLDKTINQKSDNFEQDEQKKGQSQVVTKVDSSKNTSSLSVENEKNIMISFAKCCHPVKGDPIIGYVSRGRGVIIHRADCTNIPNMSEIQSRIISVSWDDDKPSNIYKFKIVAKRINDLFGEIEGAVRKYNGNLLEGRLDDNDGVMLCGTFTLEVPSSVSVRKITKSISAIPSVDVINLI